MLVCDNKDFFSGGSYRRVTFFVISSRSISGRAKGLAHLRGEIYVVTVHRNLIAFCVLGVDEITLESDPDQDRVKPTTATATSICHPSDRTHAPFSTAYCMCGHT